MNEISPVSATIAREAAGFTASEFMRIVESGVIDGKVELVNGVIVKMPPPGLKHSILNGSIASLLINALRDRPVSVAIDLATLIDERRLRGIDIAVVRTGDAPELGAVEGRHVELAVEISDSMLANDLGQKAAEYAGVLIPHYWVVDVRTRVIHVMSEPEDGRYSVGSVVRFGEPLTVPGTLELIVVR